MAKSGVAMAQPFVEFAGNKRLLWIAAEWQSYADRLAKWAMKRIVNRRDVWSQYTLSHGKIGVVMLPIKELRAKGSHMVTMNKLRRHFSGEAPNHLIGLHSISDHSTCKWFAIDVDLHDEGVVNADEMAQTNFAVALEWATRLRAEGMDPLLFDSNGVGGYHLWVLLDRQYPLARVYDFADHLRSDWQELGLPRKPEIFPPKREVAEGDLPYTLRLPGRHHTRHHYSRVWNFDPMGDNEWLEGGEAIEAMLAVVPSKLPKLAKSAAKQPKRAAAKAGSPAKSTAKRRARVCVDLDGVLAEYDGWKGMTHIGDPLPGARDFAVELGKVADLVVFTTRCSGERSERGDDSGITPGQARIHVIDWLEAHDIPYADVYIGPGKPFAHAYVDDRAVVCRPQADPDAFAGALGSVKELIEPRRRRSARPKPD
ncbi:MAG: hypothetical protein ABJA02_06830 [Acidobacteriota bacterium]